MLENSDGFASLTERSDSKEFIENSKFLVHEDKKSKEKKNQGHVSFENILSKCHLIENSESESSVSTIDITNCGLKVDVIKDIPETVINPEIDKAVSSIEKNVKTKERKKNKCRIKPSKLPKVANSVVSSEITEESPNICDSVVSCRFCKKEFKCLDECFRHQCDTTKSKNDQSMHKCKLCSLSFSLQHQLDRHLKGHKRNNCRICNAQFTKRKALCKHLKNIHSISEPEKLYLCTFCGKQFSKRPSLNVHLKSHANGQYLCIKCGFMCESENVYSDHMKDHIKNSKFECKLCGKKFVRRQQHDQHMMGHEKHICQTCNVTFSTKKLLLKHQQTVHGTRVIVKKHECSICKKLFLRPMDLRIHQRIHTGEKPVKCSHCNKSFCSNRALSKHMKTVRHLQKVNVGEGKIIEIEKPFLCSICGALFYRQQSLIRHVEFIHTLSETFKCDQCDYSTRCKTNLKRHSELHTESKCYTCEICGASFRAFATLKEHHAFVHSDNRNFICDTCNKGFKSKSGLQRHLRIHSEVRAYKCHCNRDYKRMSHLKRHMISAHCMTFKKSSLSKTDESSDADTNNNNQDILSYPSNNEVLENPTICNEFTILPAPSNSTSEHLNSTIITENINKDPLMPISSENDVYSSVPSQTMQVFINKTEAQIIPENLGKNSLMSLLSNSRIDSTHVNHQSNLNDSNSVLDDPNYFNLSSSPLGDINVASTMPYSISQDILSLSPGQENLRPQSLPNINFQHQSNIESFNNFSLHTSDSPSALSISSFLLNPEIPSISQVSDLSVEQSASKQLFGETDDLLSLSSYTSSNQLNVSDCPPDQFFSPSRNVDIWDSDSESRLKMSNTVASTSCSNVNLSNFSNSIASIPNSLLPPNLIFSSESLISSPLDPNTKSECESLSNLC